MAKATKETKSKYYAVSARTESGDDYIYLIQATTPLEVGVKFARLMGSELGYVYNTEVAAEDYADKEKAQSAINRQIENAEIEEDEDEDY